MKNFDRVRAFAESQFKKQEKQFSLKIGATINQCSTAILRNCRRTCRRWA